MSTVMAALSDQVMGPNCGRQIRIAWTIELQDPGIKLINTHKGQLLHPPHTPTLIQEAALYELLMLFKSISAMMLKHSDQPVQSSRM